MKRLVNKDCTSLVLGSQDFECPECAKPLSVWIFGDVPLYTCSLCGGMGFRSDMGQMKTKSSKKPAAKSIEGRSLCPDCSSHMQRSSLGRMKYDTCTACGWIFVEGVTHDVIMSSEEHMECSVYSSTLRSMGGRYEEVKKHLFG